MDLLLQSWVFGVVVIVFAVAIWMLDRWYSAWLLAVIERIQDRAQRNLLHQYDLFLRRFVFVLCLLIFLWGVGWVLVSTLVLS